MPPTPPSALGHSVHKALEDFHIRKGYSFDELLESYNRCWVNEGFTQPQQAQEYFERGHQMLEQYWENMNVHANIAAIEKEFRFELPGGVMVRGTIDRIDQKPDGSYEVIDYKTHAELWDQERVDGDLQLSVYALACQRSLGYAPCSFCYYFLAHNKRMNTARTQRQIDEALATITEVAKHIKNGEFTPQLSACGTCNFIKKCARQAPQPQRSAAVNQENKSS